MMKTNERFFTARYKTVPLNEYKISVIKGKNQNDVVEYLHKKLGRNNFIIESIKVIERKR